MKYNKICLMLPTYKRTTTYLPKFIESAMNTCDNLNNISFAFCIHLTDEETKNYLNEYDFNGVGVKKVYENLCEPNLAIYFNMLHQALSGQPNTLTTMLGDDMVFRTKGWDTKILDLVNHYKGVGVFWCNDDFIAGSRCPVNLFLSRDFIEATEHPYMSEVFKGDMIDYLWGKVGKYTRTSHYLPDVHIFHDHDGSKENKDETTQRLMPSKYDGQAVGKTKAKELAWKIAEILKEKNLVGDSIC